MTFFKDHFIGFVQDRYADQDEATVQAALMRNLTWDGDVSTSHAELAALKHVPDVEYEDLPPEAMQHDAAIQARLQFYQQGIQLGAQSTATATQAAFAFIKNAIPSMPIEAARALRDATLDAVKRSVMLEAASVGLPDFMAETVAEAVGDVVLDAMVAGLDMTNLNETEEGNAE